MRADLTPEVRLFASEVFNRCWSFVERDPVLAGEDREILQEQLATHILVLMSNGDCNLLVIANRAIGMLRQQYAGKQMAVEKFA